MKVGTLGAVIISPTQVDLAVVGAQDVLDLVSRNPSPGFGIDRAQKCVVSLRGYPPMCLPIFIDGVLVSADGDLADAASPEIVDYIIILRGNEAGVLFGSVGENGLMLIYTKRGLKRGPRD